MLFRSKSQPNPLVMDWLIEAREEITVDPIVMGEIWQGIVALPEGRRKRNLIEWFTRRRVEFPCLDWTLETAIVWAELRDAIRRDGHTVSVTDTMIAATAKLHGLTVATRNVDDFIRCGVPVVNPFE